jgi:hypothetical protein
MSNDSFIALIEYTSQYSEKYSSMNNISNKLNEQSELFKKINEN